MPKHAISENIWKIIHIILPEKWKNQKYGRPYFDNRSIIEGIFYVLKSGCHWSLIPRYYGAYQTIHRRYQELVRTDFFKKLWHEGLMILHENGKLQLAHQSLDGCITKAPLGGRKTGKNPTDRSKIGTKRCVIVDQNGIPLGLSIEGANRHDSQMLLKTLNNVPYSIKIERNKWLHLDRGFDSKKSREISAGHNFKAKIALKKKRNQKTEIVKEKDIFRWVVERTHSWMNRFRSIYIRWEKKASNYQAMLELAAAITVFNKLDL